jgi:probable HAF family extracellular repeat protein
MRHIRTLAFCLFSFIFFPVSAFAQAYTVTDLGLLSPNAINSSGQVVGESNMHAFLWTPTGGSRDLGTLRGGTFSGAAAINDQGVITGTADGRGIAHFGTDNVECRTLIQPFIWTEDRGMQGLGTVVFTSSLLYYACHIGFYASGINSSVQVVGYHPEISSYEDGFLWTRAAGMGLFLGGYQTAANGNNNASQVVGNYSAYPNWLYQASHAVVWNGESVTDLGTLGGSDPDWLFCSSGNGINDTGQVVGWSTNNATEFPCQSVSAADDAPHAVLWSVNEAIQDLGTLPGDGASAAVKINSAGQVIGSSGNTVTSQDAQHGGELIQVLGRPFIWSQNSGMQDLNALIPENSGWVLNSVADISASGAIVGLGTVNGQVRGFLLTPKGL